MWSKISSSVMLLRSFCSLMFLWLLVMHTWSFFLTNKECLNHFSLLHFHEFMVISLIFLYTYLSPLLLFVTVCMVSLVLFLKRNIFLLFSIAIWWCRLETFFLKIRLNWDQPSCLYCGCKKRGVPCLTCYCWLRDVWGGNSWYDYPCLCCTKLHKSPFTCCWHAKLVWICFIYWRSYWVLH